MSKRILLAVLLSMLALAGCASKHPPEFLVSHILCRTQAEASAATARIRRGEAFERVATEVSIDTGTRSGGGRIQQWTRADDFSAAFAAEVKRLKVGAVSDSPVKTEFGWHVLRVDDVR